MRRTNLIFVLTIALLLTLFTMPAFSQEEAATPPAEAAAAKPEPAQPEELSIYGEVQSMNEASDSIAVQYYDYDSDEEKTIDIDIDKDTAMEGAAKLADIKQNEWVDVTYSIRDGKSIAKTIRVEVEEELPEEAAPEKSPVEIPKEE